MDIPSKLKHTKTTTNSLAPSLAPTPRRPVFAAAAAPPPGAGEEGALEEAQAECERLEQRVHKLQSDYSATASDIGRLVGRPLVSFPS